MTTPARCFFLMVNHPTRGWVRVGNAYASRKAAQGWRGFVRKAWRGCRVRVAQFTPRYAPDGTLTDASRRTLDEKFNLEPPSARAGAAGSER